MSRVAREREEEQRATGKRIHELVDVKKIRQHRGKWYTYIFAHAQHAYMRNDVVKIEEEGFNERVDTRMTLTIVCIEKHLFSPFRRSLDSIKRAKGQIITIMVLLYVDFFFLFVHPCLFLAKEMLRCRWRVLCDC